jgi:hypothetical protein
VAAVQEYLANASTILSDLRDNTVVGGNTTRVNGLRSTVEAAAEALASSGNVDTTLAVLRSGLADISRMGQEVVRAAFGARDNAAGPVLAALAGPSMMGTTQPAAVASMPTTQDPGSLAAALDALELRSSAPSSTNSSSGDLVLNNSTTLEVNATAPAMEEGVNATMLEQGAANSTGASTSEAATSEAASTTEAAPQEALDADGDEPAASGEQAPAERGEAPVEGGEAQGEGGEAPAASGRRRRLHRRALLWA